MTKKFNFNSKKIVFIEICVILIIFTMGIISWFWIKFNQNPPYSTYEIVYDGMSINGEYYLTISKKGIRDLGGRNNYEIYFRHIVIENTSNGQIFNTCYSTIFNTKVKNNWDELKYDVKWLNDSVSITFYEKENEQYFVLPFEK